MMNIINGGAHSDAPIDFQEFMIMPKGLPSFSEALRAGCGDFSRAERRVEEARPLHGGRRRRRFRAEPGERGGRAGNHRPGGREGRLQVRRANLHRARCRRVRSSTTRKQKHYVFKKSDGSQAHARTRWSPIYEELARKFPIISIEDGCAENDWDGWKKLTDALGEQGATRRRRLVRHERASSCERRSTTASPTRFW